MLVYFEIHFDDANGYWIDNIKPTEQVVKSNRGFDIDFTNNSKGEDYGIIIDLSAKFYHTGGDLKPILKEFKEKYLLELRKKKIKKIKEKY